VSPAATAAAPLVTLKACAPCAARAPSSTTLVTPGVEAMAAEVIGADGVRIKYAARRLGRLQLVAAPEPPVQLHALSALMHRLEACGMLPVLSDGLVGGNAAIAATACRLEPGTGGWEPAGSAPATADGSSQPQSPSGAILISRSGKQPGVPLLAADWVLLSSFDPSRWAVDYRSAEEAARPSSDAPLHAAALGPAAAQRYGWAAAPLVAVHGHALAEGEGEQSQLTRDSGMVFPQLRCMPACHSASFPSPAQSQPLGTAPASLLTACSPNAGLERARAAGLPISERETLFSTPEDLEELELLFRWAPSTAAAASGGVQAKRCCGGDKEYVSSAGYMYGHLQPRQPPNPVSPTSPPPLASSPTLCHCDAGRTPTPTTAATYAGGTASCC
jgi:hypothetical protein